MSDITLFENNPLAGSDLLAGLLETTDTLAGSDFDTKRISLRGGRFRNMAGGEQVAVNSSGRMNIIVLRAAELSRTYYAGVYDPENPTPPACWSLDTKTPAPEVSAVDRQSARCIDCPQNIKGSGQGESRACRFAQRLAIALDGDLETVYQLQLPATSLFGDAVAGNMPMKAYAKQLKAHGMPIIAVVTEMYFDEDSDTPKLYFKPVRPLTEDEIAVVVEARDSQEATNAVTMSVSQTDKVQEFEIVDEPEGEDEKDEAYDGPKEVKKEPVNEPKKAAKKKKAAPKAKAKEAITAAITGWD